MRIHTPKQTTPEPFKLFMACLGNGTTVCNSAVTDEDTRDYKMIAHINDAGVITWYIKQYRIPADARAEIESYAVRERDKWLKVWHKMPSLRKYGLLLEWMNIGELITFNQWLRAIPVPRDIDRLIDSIISGKMCRNAYNVYGL